jgi:hypothetical protein
MFTTPFNICMPRHFTHTDMTLAKTSLKPELFFMSDYQQTLRALGSEFLDCRISVTYKFQHGSCNSH